MAYVAPSRVTRTVVHPVDEAPRRPLLALYGLQHLRAFYAGAVVVPIVLGNALSLSSEQLVYLINADLFTAGIATVIQPWGFWRIGARLRPASGATVTAMAPMIATGQGAGGGTAGLLVVYGAVITERPPRARTRRQEDETEAITPVRRRRSAPPRSDPIRPAPPMHGERSSQDMRGSWPAARPEADTRRIPARSRDFWVRSEPDDTVLKHRWTADRLSY